MKAKKLLFVGLLVLVFSTSCGEKIPTLTPAATSTPRPTDTLTPTDTPVPTDTLAPATTHTPSASATPEPTETPTLSPELIFSGTGDTSVDIARAAGPALIHIVGNAQEGYFSVKSFDSAGQLIDLLVSTSAYYDGVRFLDFSATTHTTQLLITAKGEWTIEIWSVHSAHRLDGPGRVEGTGDDVIWLDRAEGPALLRVAKEAEGAYLAVSSFTADGQAIDLVVGTKQVYTGTHPLDFGAGERAAWLEVLATAAWSIELLPVESGRTLTVPGSLQGNGDEVIFLDGVPSQATITGNLTGGFFGVVGYNGEKKVLVTTTDTFEGTVDLHPDTAALFFKAVGMWSVAVTEP